MFKVETRTQDKQGWALVAFLTGAAVTAGLLAFANAAVASRVEHRNPANGKFLTVDGVRLHYLDQGSGPVVVLLHGNQVMAEDYRVSGLLDLVARNHRVIAFDRPGFGYSERPRTRVWTPQAQADLIAAALRQLGIERPTMVGHSLGGLVALAFALDHPDQTGGLVLLSGYYYPSLRPDVPLASLLAIPVVGDILRYTVAPIWGWLTSPVMLKGLFSPSPIPSQYAGDLPLSMTLRPSQLRATSADAAMMVPAAVKLQGRYRELTMPIAIVAGRGDKIVWVNRQPERLHVELPDSSLHVFEGVGHMVHHAGPHRVAEVIEQIAGLAARLPAQGGSQMRPAA